MQPNPSACSLIFRVASKEITLFFASPIAYLFLASFAVVTLFVFFWGEAFFSRNIADVRPLFEWMPLLLIFLASTLTMRLWSEERRTGTLEYVLTQPAPLWQFVLGKFVGCLTLIIIALAITLPLPITVAWLGELDWGPVFAGYLATFMLGAAYMSIGLFVSARSDNQIVSLISATALCLLLFVLGTNTLTDLVGYRAGEWLRALGTGSRFDAITRGVLDLRDLYYYLSIIAVFLALNTYVLERERWAARNSTPHHGAWRILTLLLVANALCANLWLGQISGLRVDVTAGNQYSLSSATTRYLQQLQEPLLVRGYFSSKTHPLLAPLVPQLRDLLKEYEIAGQGKVRVEFIDPIKEPEREEEANQKYGIQATPFQVADRYQSAIVSSYFNVLVQYGDEHQVLGFRDLIEVKARSESDLEVKLRNPEHDLTRAIKKVLHSYQAGGNLFDTVKGELTFNAYVSDDQALPKELAEFRGKVEKIVRDMQQQAQGRLQAHFIDPDADGGKIGQQIAADYGFQPMATNLFSNERFYFYLTLAKGDQLAQIPLDDLSEDSFERNLKAAVKRFSSGFTKTVALVTPAAEPAYPQYGMSGSRFNRLEAFLGAELNIQREDLDDGQVSGDADILLLAAPENLNEKALFAVDQFLMQGGTVVAATSPYRASLNNRSLSLLQQNSGLEKWLAFQGLQIENKLVLDPQNAAFPIPVTRQIGGFQIQELRMLDYPYFIDLRHPGLAPQSPITAELPQLTVAWASPITLDAQRQGQREVIELLRSSDRSWLSDSTDVMPRVGDNGVSTYQSEGETKAHLLGLISSGRFDSYFAGKQSPILADVDAPEAEGAETTDQTASKEESDFSFSGVIERSPESARIILFSSNDFLSDQVIQLAGSASGSEYLNSLQLVANSLDWALEDTGLSSIRSRGHFNRTLVPLTHQSQLFWEYLNYALAALALVLVALVQRRVAKVRARRYATLLTNNS